ncbi:hypothetical protein LRP88_05490 [Fusarium phalaenopsidis]
MSGYSVIAVTSRDEIKAEATSRGADHVFSNSESDLVKKIRAVAPNLRHTFDTVVTSDTMANIVECCEKPAKVATAIKYNGPEIDGVQITPVYSGEIMGKTMGGLPSAAGLELGKWLWGDLDQWIKSDQITPLEYEELDGLKSVQNGLEALESGKARRKLVTTLTQWSKLFNDVSKAVECIVGAGIYSRHWAAKRLMICAEHPDRHAPWKAPERWSRRIEMIDSNSLTPSANLLLSIGKPPCDHGSVGSTLPNIAKYIQTQVFDSAFGSRPDGPLNANQHWVGRDDTTELFFRDWDHVKTCFSSEFVKTIIGPDGPLFADFETSVVLMAYEKPIPVQTTAAEERAKPGNADLDVGNATVAMYFISTPDDVRDGTKLEQVVTPLLLKSLEAHCQANVRGVVCNVGAVSDKFDLNAYFGGADMPQYALVYKLFLTGAGSVTALRRAQSEFEETASRQGFVDLHKSFILFSHEALVMDVGNGIRFSLDRQVTFKDLPGPSHLDSESNVS